jgi:hypothetical protein
MLRFYMPVAFGILFLAWVAYHGLVRRDLRRHLHSFFLGLSFFTLWGLIYWWIFSH